MNKEECTCEHPLPYRLYNQTPECLMCKQPVSMQRFEECVVQERERIKATEQRMNYEYLKNADLSAAYTHQLNFGLGLNHS